MVNPVENRYSDEVFLKNEDFLFGSIKRGKRGFKLQNIKQKMSTFSITKDELLAIVAANQTRTFAQEIDLLQQRNPPVEWLLKGLNTDPKKGVSSSAAQLEQRQKQLGSNKKYQPPLSTFCEHFKDALDDFIQKILIASSIISIAIEVGTATSESVRRTAWIDGFVILVAVAVCAMVTAVNDYSKERQFAQLNKVADERKRITIIRDGKILDIHQDDVLVGDVVQVNQGMEVPADAILIEANQITTDQSAMTGEADPIHKATFENCLAKKLEVESNGDEHKDKHEVPSPILLSGTKVLTGEGKMVIMVVGDLSCIGKIRALLTQQEESMTPLQAKLQKLATTIGKFGLYSAILILVVLLVRFGIEKSMDKTWDTSKDLRELISYFMLAITVIVVAIPEGLPLSVTLSLAVSVKQMLNDSNLVRKLEACETMGGANNICSDKTGTLTMNKMTLTQVWNGSTIEIDSHKEALNIQDITNNQEWAELLKIGACVDSTALLQPEQKGSSTEIALLKFMSKLGVNYSTYREMYPTILKYPFSSARKRMSVLLTKDSENYLFVKGASEMVLGCCNQWYDMKTNKVEPITQALKGKMEETIKKMAESSLRTLCLAYRKISTSEDLQTKDQNGVFSVQKNNLILVCLFGVRDIPRKEVPDAIAKCHKAGIKVRMVTGDNIITAKAIARDVGIIKEGDDSLVMEGADFIKMIGGVVCKKCRTATCDCAKNSKEAEAEDKELRVDTIQNAAAFDLIKDKLCVLARSRPEDKYALVTGLKERGQVVAVTGDGTNDAPALKKADVGFAMGIAGTQVARQAAAIILLDDNFNSIVKAVLWGRNIYDSIRKFIQFQITVNIVAVTITLVGSGFYKQQILAPIQMLWINLIMDTLASLALATESPTEELLERPPNSRHENIISKTMMKHILGQAVFQFIIMVVLVFAGERFIPEGSDSYDTTVFNGRPEWKWHNGVVGGTIRSGRLITITGGDDYRSVFDQTGIYSRHFTFIFNTFVMMQVFNFVGCRKIHEERNIFAGILTNKLFIIIVLSIFGLQAIIITFAGEGFQVYKNYGLTIEQWLISMAIGFFALPINFLLKLFPVLEDQPKETSQSNEDGAAQFAKSNVEGLTEIKLVKIQRTSGVSKDRPANSVANSTYQEAYNFF